MNPKRNCALIDFTDHALVWIRNRIHLLTAKSKRVKEVKKHLLILGPCLAEGLFKPFCPHNLVRHKVGLLQELSI